MRVGLLAVLLVLALGSGALAQSPSPEPPPWFEGRVEMPEHGFAITVPDGMVAIDPRGDEEAQWRIAEEAASGWLIPPSDGPVLQDLYLAAGPGAAPQTRQYCGISMSAVGNLDQALGAGEDLMSRAVAGEEVPIDVRDARMLEVSAGAAVVWYHGDSWHRATYFVVRDDRTIVFDCWTEGPGLPDDDWLSIAETIEFLPAEE